MLRGFDAHQPPRPDLLGRRPGGFAARVVAGGRGLGGEPGEGGDGAGGGGRVVGGERQQSRGGVQAEVVGADRGEVRDRRPQRGEFGGGRFPGRARRVGRFLPVPAEQPEQRPKPRGRRRGRRGDERAGPRRRLPRLDRVPVSVGVFLFPQQRRQQAAADRGVRQVVAAVGGGDEQVQGGAVGRAVGVRSGVAVGLRAGGEVLGDGRGGELPAGLLRRLLQLPVVVVARRHAGLRGLLGGAVQHPQGVQRQVHVGELFADRRPALHVLPGGVLRVAGAEVGLVRVRLRVEDGVQQDLAGLVPPAVGGEQRRQSGLGFILEPVLAPPRGGPGLHRLLHERQRQPLVAGPGIRGEGDAEHPSDRAGRSLVVR